MTNKPRVVIAQKNYEDLEGIRCRVGDGSPFRIEYTSDPEEALGLAAKSDTKVLVSGLSFHGGNLDAFSIAERAGWGPEYMEGAFGKYGNLTYGANMVRAAREANPELITLMYSYLFESRDLFCGMVEKFRGPDALVALLNDPGFLTALGSKERKILPEIKEGRWYLDNFPESWK